MTASLTSILRRRNIVLAEGGGDINSARARMHVWQRVWADFSNFTMLLSLVHQDGRVPDDAHNLAADLAAIGCLEIEDARGGLYAKIPHNDAKRLLSGGWLEELGACAVADAGAEEVRFGQRILWRSGSDPSTTFTNEIDVIGRFGTKLLLISCKAMRPKVLHGAGGQADDAIFDAMLEIHYWSEHFGGERLATPALLTTVDMFDEKRRRPRHPGLVERARVLDLSILPADLTHYRMIVEHISQVATTLHAD